VRQYEKEAKVIRGNQREEDYKRVREVYISWKSQPSYQGNY
jgi:hypothetical protein